MGCCASCAASPDRLINLEVNKEISGDRAASERVQKLLFLGSGGSGKSTFFKQLKCIHGKGFTDKDRRVFREHISTQIIEQMSRCVECIPYHNERLSELDDQSAFTPLALSDAGEAAARYLMEEIPPDHLVNREVAQSVSILWSEPAIQSIYANRAHFHIDDSSAYFFAHIDRIGACEGYLPSDLDILFVRYRTTGVIEAKFSIRGSAFTILDVGGQQSERKKWIHCFEKVTAVIFVASLSCYDEVMFEDDQVNCMHDSLQLFREICSLQWFVVTPIILFLNKRDLFEAKIHIIPLSVCFEEFAQRPPNASSILNNTEQKNSATQPMLKTEDVDVDVDGDVDGSSKEEMALLTAEQKQYMKASMDFIRQRFLAMSGNRRQGGGGSGRRNLSAAEEKRQVYVHITTATDISNVTRVFSDVQQIVVSAGLTRNNLI